MQTQIGALWRGLPYTDLTASERLFLYLLRSHVKARTGTACGPAQIPPALCAFVDSFWACLSDGLLIAPIHCRCPLQLYEQDLINLLRAHLKGDFEAFTMEVQDLLPAEVIERLWRLAPTVEDEVTAELNML